MFIEYEWHDFIGNLGVFFIIVTYFLLQAGKMDATSIKYSLINGLGAVLILISLYFEFNLSSFIIECAWVAISIYGIARTLANRKNNPPSAQPANKP